MKSLYNPTILYALLVFIGFLNYHSFYITFDIQIAPFLTLGELLLSFMPLTIPILITIAFFSFFQLAGITALAYNVKNPMDNYDGDEPNDFLFRIKNAPKQIREVLKLKKWKSGLTYINLLIFGIQFLVSIFLFLFIVLYPTYLIGSLYPESSKFPDSTANSLWVISLFWIFLFDSFIIRAFKDRQNYKFLARGSLFILISIGVIVSMNRKHAFDILNCQPTTGVDFIYNGQKVSSDSTKMFIGLTERYLFIRDISKGKNLIYKLEEIKYLEMESIESNELPKNKNKTGK
ncbi:hypothetical protein [Flagellimonas sediminis]|uniref:Uncharacterized protein n=1 Tax=Flagellimonas sediminis TaxID=2696468 RepID=A0A6I5L255_9FLAO|nr:hypothetical protein [Allomuricauda sediminis]NDV43120.1 hypothetical protein [Allomuricauda sediminis]